MPDTLRARFRHLIEAALPWFDREAEEARNARTEAIRERSIKARIEAERIRKAYTVAAERLRR